LFVVVFVSTSGLHPATNGRAKGDVEYEEFSKEAICHTSQMYGLECIAVCFEFLRGEPFSTFCFGLSSLGPDEYLLKQWLLCCV
jgi:hypothetical protein